MALNIKRISETIHAKVYTEDGHFLGEVEDALISGNKIYGWKIKVLDPILSKRKGIRGVIVPHQLVKAMGEIWIVSRAVYSIKVDEEELKEKEMKFDKINENENIKIEKIK
ncbi:MAG: PRC-barrel domain-containing protein [Nanopusillaceae archaeon]